MNEIMPVLDPEEITEVAYMAVELPDRSMGMSWQNKQRQKAIAKAQNKADRKWMVEWIERIAVVRAPFMSPFNSPTAPPYLELDLKEFLVFKGALK